MGDRNAVLRFIIITVTKKKSSAKVVLSKMLCYTIISMLINQDINLHKQARIVQLHGLEPILTKEQGGKISRGTFLSSELKRSPLNFPSLQAHKSLMKFQFRKKQAHTVGLLEQT
jgi:hypothetical protein